MQWNVQKAICLHKVKQQPDQHHLPALRTAKLSFSSALLRTKWEVGAYSHYVQITEHRLRLYATTPSSKSCFTFAFSALLPSYSTASLWLSGHTHLSRTNCAHEYRNAKKLHRYLTNWTVIWKVHFNFSTKGVPRGTQIWSMTVTVTQGRDSNFVLSICWVVIINAIILICNAYTNAYCVTCVS